MTLMEQAEANLEALRRNRYPGRGLVVGIDETGLNMIQVSWIMGRSDDSQNRIYVEDVDEEGSVRTAPFAPAKLKSSKNIIYRTMAERGGLYIVSNGDQTDTVWNDCDRKSFYQSMFHWSYETDAPIYTSRISAVCDLRWGIPPIEISILRRSQFSPGCERNFYHYDTFDSGVGYCVTTYKEDGNPPPPFRGDPYLLPLIGGITHVAATIWDALNEDNRVALAVKFINFATDKLTPKIKIINKHAVA